MAQSNVKPLSGLGFRDQRQRHQLLEPLLEDHAEHDPNDDDDLYQHPGDSPSSTRSFFRRIIDGMSHNTSPVFSSPEPSDAERHITNAHAPILSADEGEFANLEQHTVVQPRSPTLRRAGLLHPPPPAPGPRSLSYTHLNLHGALRPNVSRRPSFPGAGPAPPGPSHLHDAERGVSVASSPSSDRAYAYQPHSQDTIRASTMKLSGMSMSASSSIGKAGLARPASSQRAVPSALSLKEVQGQRTSGFQLEGQDAETSRQGSSQRAEDDIRTEGSASSSPPQPSGLSIMIAQERQRAHSTERPDDSEQRSRSPQSPRGSSSGHGHPNEHDEQAVADRHRHQRHRPKFSAHELTPLLSPTQDLISYSTSSSANSSSPALGSKDRTWWPTWLNRRANQTNSPSPPNGAPHPTKTWLQSAWKTRKPTKVSVRNATKDTARSAVRALPAVLLGSLLNILDGVSYGMIIFPATGVFAAHQAGPMGVSMFFVSCVIAQLAYVFGGSGFAGANGSMMIEVVPFFHILATSITDQLGEDHPSEVMATTLAAYALSSILTGLAFFLLGALRLGTIMGFFPRHILVGCIGGVGAFLIETGLTVSTRIDDDDFAFDWTTFKFMFLDTHNLTLWLIPLFLAILLRLITHKYNHQLVFPLYFIVIPMLFYIIVAAGQLDLTMLRREGWLFDMGSGEQVTWYKFYTYFDFGAISYSALWNTLPTQFALLFFNVLHPPLNVPALSVSLNEDVDTNRELVGHGYSNLLAGLLGTVPNYLVYVNTLLFYRVGGTTRVAGLMLAAATSALLLIGTGPIAFIPVMVVGALIFVLGIDLVKEALWDTRHRVSRTEYITIVSIMVCMTVWDFVIGVLFGIVVSCFFFVVQNSQRRSIRSFHTGEAAMSTVRRPAPQRNYLREVSRQTTILKLQGFLFFGTIVSVEECIREVLEGPSWQRNPVRFLVLDLTLVAGVDMSAAEAFVRVHRLVTAKHVILVFCGFDAASPVGLALESVEVLGAEGVELFSTFNDAMEWTENAYLRAWFRTQKYETSSYTLPGRSDADIQLAASFKNSPRVSHLQAAAKRTLSTVEEAVGYGPDDEPFNTLVKAFSSYGEISSEQYRPMIAYLERLSVPEGQVLWRQDDPPDALYIIESGVLRATYRYSDYSQTIEECMVPGTLAGELTALSNSPRNATAVVERPAVLWKLSVVNLRKLEREKPALFWSFCQLVLKAAKIDYDMLLASLATRQ